MITYIWRRFHLDEKRDPETGFWRLLRDGNPIGDFNNQQRDAVNRAIHEISARTARIETDLTSSVVIPTSL